MAACHNPAMRLDDPFDELVVSLGGFYRTWYVVRRASSWACSSGCARRAADGLTAAALAAPTGTDADLVRRWAWGADVHDLVELDGDRIVLFEDVAAVLLDADRPEYLGGQFLHAAIGSLDFDVAPGRLPHRGDAGDAPGPLPDRHRAAHRPGRRRLLPGGPRLAATARRRPRLTAR